VLLLSGAVTPESVWIAELRGGLPPEAFTMKELVYRCERLIVHQRKSELGARETSPGFKSTGRAAAPRPTRRRVLHIDASSKEKIPT
jgi:hypothetical protein